MLFGAGAEDIFQAIRNNQLSSLKTLVADKSSVNIRGDREVTPLLYAAAYGSPEAVHLLVQAGADPMARNALGATALI
jgi:ankyrin repeat protein